MLKKTLHLIVAIFFFILIILIVTTLNNKKGYYTYTFENNGRKYSNIHVFETNPKKQTIAPAIYVTGDKQILEDMKPLSIEIQDIVARTNAGVMEVSKDKTAFYGLYYLFDSERKIGNLYMDGIQLGLMEDKKTENPNETVELDGIKYIGAKSSELNNLHARYYPCFCVGFDGSATIDWFTQDNIVNELPKYESIIGACHPLVYESKSVFDEVVYDASDEETRIADWDDLNNLDYRYNEKITETSKIKTIRTLLGHKPDKSYIMVVVEDFIDLREAAHIMKKLGCDFAVNLDGSVSSQMWLSDKGKITTITDNKHTYYGVAIIAYNRD